MASFEVLSKPGDTVDLLVWRATGKGPAAVEQVLQANPGLADLGTILPYGTRVTIPETATTAAAKPLVQLWS